jgi:hypothetical protein
MEMTSVRSIPMTLLASIMLAGAASAGDSASDQPDLGALWGAVEYCKAKHAKDPEAKQKYAQAVRPLRKRIRGLSRQAQHSAVESKESIYARGTYQGRALNRQECAKLRKKSELAAQKPAPSGAANPEKTGDQQ